MTTNQFISVRETAQILGVSEKKVMDLISDRKLQAYRIADKFLRLKKSEVQELRNSGTISSTVIQHEYTAPERIRDFLYFNDFYIVAFAIIIFLLYYIILL